MRVSHSFLKPVLSAGLLFFACVFFGAVKAEQEGDDAIAKDYRDGGFYALYADNRRQGIANYISEDFLLQGYSMLRARQLRRLEREQLLPALEKTVAGLTLILSGAHAEMFSLRTTTYVQLLQALLTGNDTAVHGNIAQSELQLIRQANGLEQSPLWGYVLDYSQFKARAHYGENDPDLQRYFVASRYANSVLYPVVASASTGVSAEQAEQFAIQSLELSLLLNMPDVAPHYRELTKTLDWHFGPADDLTDVDVRSIVLEAGQNLTTALYSYALNNHKVPTILSLPLHVDALEDGMSASDAQVGWRLLPARRSADAQAMQHVVSVDQQVLRWPCTDCVKPAMASAMSGGWRKAYPSYVELMALQGSVAAKAQVQKLGLYNYSAYEKQLRLASDVYTQVGGLQAAQLPVWRAALAGVQADQALHSGAGFWLWQRSLALLYQKQSTTPFSKSIALEVQPRSGATLAKNTPLYLALFELSQKHEQHDNSHEWQEFSDIVMRCVQISRALDANESISDDDNAFLNNLDRQLLMLTGRDDAAFVVDLHSNYQDKQVLQLALSFPKISFLGAARGARFNVQEFVQPLDQRLDNHAWRQMLQGQN